MTMHGYGLRYFVVAIQGDDDIESRTAGELVDKCLRLLGLRIAAVRQIDPDRRDAPAQAGDMPKQRPSELPGHTASDRATE